MRSKVDMSLWMVTEAQKSQISRWERVGVQADKRDGGWEYVVLYIILLARRLIGVSGQRGLRPPRFSFPMEIVQGVM